MLNFEWLLFYEIISSFSGSVTGICNSTARVIGYNTGVYVGGLPSDFVQLPTDMTERAPVCTGLSLLVPRSLLPNQALILSRMGTRIPYITELTVLSALGGAKST